VLIVFTTTPDADEAERLAEAIVNERLAGCVQIMPKMTSVYYWEGGVQKEPEHLLLIKTTEAKFGALKTYILENHSYDVPEIVAFSSVHVSESYDGWLRDYLS
jgi:uncharacterized protein involved in tolerance to divalent cations